MGRHRFNREQLQAEGHRLFDALWTGRERVGEQSFRVACYAWLAMKLGVPTHAAHFSAMNTTTLIKAILVLRSASWRKIRRWHASERRRTKREG